MELKIRTNDSFGFTDIAVIEINCKKFVTGMNESTVFSYDELIALANLIK